MVALPSCAQLSVTGDDTAVLLELPPLQAVRHMLVASVTLQAKRHRKLAMFRFKVVSSSVRLIFEPNQLVVDCRFDERCQ